MSTTMCCTHLLGRNQNGSSSTSPYMARHLGECLAAGTFTFRLSSEISVCKHMVAHDRWHFLPESSILENSLASDSDHELCQWLGYLTTYCFIIPTCLVNSKSGSDAMVIVRIYLLPSNFPTPTDTGHVHPPAIINTARKYLRGLITYLNIDPQRWEGEVTSDPGRPFLRHHVDNRTMAEMYTMLKSPAPVTSTHLDNIPGLRSTLYLYQKEAVAEMLNRERALYTRADPSYIPIEGLNGNQFFIRPATVEVQRSCPQARAVRGGILCEELGTGKTVMVLALILHTLNEMPQPEYSDHEARPVLPTNPPSYHQTPTPPKILVNTRKRAARPQIRRMYLSKGTLIIVPPTLVGQWKNEIMRHCDDTLRTLVLRAGDSMPSANVLASSYDIILMGVPRFTEEGKKKDLESNLCVSPLFQVHWKRLVIDEGHVAANMDTALLHLGKQLSIERRWLITGTPTTHLLGLDFGQGSDLTYPEVDMEGYDSDVNSETDEIEIDNADKLARRWTPDDRRDLRKLSVMVEHFLGIRLFAQSNSGSDDFATLVIKPLMNSAGPLAGAIPVLEQVMNAVMVRHRIEDVERDILLPLLQHDTVLLDLDSYAAKSYNAMQAAIAVNAIDSGRAGQDYLFHPKNKYLLAMAIENMSQVLFWHVDSDGLFNVDNLAADPEMYVETAQERQTAPQDIELLKRALAHTRSVSNDRAWRALQARPDISHRTTGMPRPILVECAISGQTVTRGDALVSSDRLEELRDLVSRQPLAKTDRIAEWAATANDAYEIQILNAQTQLNFRKRRIQDNANNSTPAELQRIGSRNVKAKQEELRREREGVMKRLKALSEEGDDYPAIAAANHADGISSERAAMLAASPLAGVRVLNSTSSKLDYILNEVHSYGKEEKMLIFSKSRSTLALVADGLKLLGVKYLVYGNGVPSAERRGPREREHTVTTFETSDLYRVMLMELKWGARGLNLVSASRVIFCEPIWQPDVEAQAIKRVHRIGQIQPVTVKTLAIRNTYEEFMMQRRDALIGEQLDLLEDRRMRDFIANPRFLEVVETAPSSRLNVPLLRIPQRNETHGQIPSPLMRPGTSTPPVSGVSRLALGSSTSTSAGPSRAATPTRTAKRPAVHFDDEMSVDRPTLEQSAGGQDSASESRNSKKPRSANASAFAT